MRKLLNTLGVAFLAVVLLSVFVGNAVKAQYIDAKTIDILGRLITSTGLASWPSYASDPATCNSSSEGAYYFNTGSSKFRTCDGSTWADREGATDLDGLSDVFVSGPADGEVIRYDGVTDNRWENQAASASAIDDLSDVVITAAGSGEVLSYDGADWINSSTGTGTLDGMTDTDFTAPADRDQLRFDGADWLNEPDHVGPTFLLFPIYDETERSITSSTIINADNQMKAFCWVFKYPITVDRIIWGTDTVTDVDCDFGSVSVWEQDGTTKLLDSGPVAYSLNDQTVSVDVTDTRIEAGTYYVVYTATATSASCTVLSEGPAGGTNDGYEDFFTNMETNGGCSKTGTAANPSVAGQVPATLGAITHNQNVSRPVILFMGS